MYYHMLETEINPKLFGQQKVVSLHLHTLSISPVTLTEQTVEVRC